MSQSRERRTRTVDVSPRGELPGLRVVGFHGEVDAAHTPARRAPVLVDEEGWLVRISPSNELEAQTQAVETRPLRVLVERGSLQVEAGTAPLPGVGTRLGPWPARFGYTVVLLGEAERRAAPRLRELVTAGEPAVSQFVEWLAAGCPSPAPALAVQLERLVAWYCSLEEAHALWQHILQEARLTVIRAFAQRQPSPALEEAAWWLSRAALTDEDLFLAAACLKHAGSPHPTALLRAMLREPLSTEAMEQRMSEQLLFLDAEARLGAPPSSLEAPLPSVSSYAELSRARDSVRRRSGIIGAR